MREWRRQQKLKREKHVPAWQHVFSPPVSPHIRRTDVPTTADAGKPVSVKGRHIGWIDQDGQFTKEPLAPAPKASEKSSSRKVLRSQYSALRALGYDDAQAQMRLMRQRQKDQEASRAHKEAQDYQHAVEKRVAAFMKPAQRWLMQNAGYFTPAMQQDKARELSEHDLHMRQTPRLPDEWTRRQLLAPLRSRFP